ncbi:MAG TPA: SDR family oxidoreductase, partial [Sphingomicrobium sp.]|nr:SDR family oxidoreductase [Sphingomicrobium sp.]
DGAHVFVHYNRSSKEADVLIAEIETSGGSAEAVAANLEDVQSVNLLISEIKERLGDRKLDILINNAGIFEVHPLGDDDPSALDRLLAVNVRAPYQIASGLVDRLSSDARVLFTSSIASKNALPGIGAYGLTKGAIDTLTRYLAAELGERGIRVNAIAPGAIDTDMASDFLGTEESREWIKSAQALKRIGRTEDIANVDGFLTGPDSGWVTGQVIDASGGYRL